MGSFEGVTVDVIMDILSRLGAKDLCKSRCVSKQWLNIIADPGFKKLRRYRVVPRLLLHGTTFSRDAFVDSTFIAHVSTVSIPSDDVAVVFNNFGFNLLGGFFIKMFGYDLVCVLDGSTTFVSNPTTCKVIRLPDFNHSGICVLGAGLGYLPCRNEYKIIIIFDHPITCNDSLCRQPIVEMFSLRDGRPSSGSWRKIPNCPSVCKVWNSGKSAVCVGGKIYWLYSERYVGKEELILSLDFESEKFTTIPSPADCSGLNHDMNDERCLIELKECVCLTQYKGEDSAMNIWLLMDYETQIWVKEYVIDLRGMGDYCKVLGYVPRDDHTGKITIWSSEERLLFYDIGNNSIERMDNWVVPKHGLRSLYFDCLFSLWS